MRITPSMVVTACAAALGAAAVLLIYAYSGKQDEKDPETEDEVQVREFLRKKRAARMDRQRTLTNESIREAVQLWCKDHEAAAARFGHISDWDTSACTDMHSLFIGQGSFNDDISAWDTSQVTTMCQMFDAASSFDQR